MLSKLLKNTISIIIFVIVIVATIGFILNLHLSEPKVYAEKVCYKGRLLVRISEDDTLPVYTKMRGVTCEVSKDILIIEDVSDEQ